MWAYLLVLLLLFSVAGGSGFPVLAETERVEDVSTEAENMEAAEMEAGETEAEEKAGKQDRQADNAPPRARSRRNDCRAGNGTAHAPRRTR